MSKFPKDFSVWSGVYENFGDVPVKKDVHNSERWIEKQIQNALRAFTPTDQKISIPANAKSRDYPLAAMVAALLADGRNLSLLDYGGAMGQTYIELTAKIPLVSEQLSCTVLETQGVVDNVPAEIHAMKGLSFITAPEQFQGKPDILHLGSTLQYIDDWRGFLSGLIKKFDPEFFVLSDLLVGDIPSFVTAQNYYEDLIPVRYINIKEFLDFWATKPYRLCYRSYYYPLENENYFPSGGLPETHRIKTACHLAFAKA